MRGSSRREDAAFWIIDLSEAHDANELQHGTKFVTRFLKNRNVGENECPPLQWSFFKPPGDQKVRVSWEKLSTMQLLRQCVEDGTVRASDIAKQLAISRFKVSRLAAQAIKEGWLKKNGRNYAITTPNPMDRWFKEVRQK